jgi:SNF2 family DNA or RNA helicase
VSLFPNLCLSLRLNCLLTICRNHVPKRERVLLFVQFPDLTKKVAEALDAHKIPFIEIRGTAAQKSKNLTQFQKDGAKEKVLLLNVGDESASGA